MIRKPALLLLILHLVRFYIPNQSIKNLKKLNSEPPSNETKDTKPANPPAGGDSKQTVNEPKSGSSDTKKSDQTSSQVNPNDKVHILLKSI